MNFTLQELETIKKSLLIALYTDNVDVNDIIKILDRIDEESDLD